ncbi:c-type cytochrome biogenesis protein CcmI [Zavarzinia compransoris]|uniref:C-type cytochrome biogenesis protein CcmI n=1 Tax=Zavarzinia compransoris TaxID=1264899 RepID=A0A317E715_9PROT|nr:c-type cytochrome biogenesis protein CcmI [Zavarzinia compransoris]PWR22074.1 c-type cytochrome biogenesis protein CcmI [Zavarzinia compransoris]TDP47184.1 cytochrome c-type biogenesis protein CcmH [Zavarzinia compransoris]
MMFAIFGLVAAAVAIALLRPLLKAGAGHDAAASERAVYRAQLRELAAEQVAGAVAPAEAEAARLEIERRLLRVGAGAAVSARPSLVLALVVAIGVPAAAALLYDRLGAAGLADQPLSARLTEAGQEAETAKLIAALEARMAEVPDDPRGWELLARARAAEGRLIPAAEAYERIVALVPDQVQARLAAAELRIAAAGGAVPPEAAALVAQALEQAPADPAVRHFAAFVRLAGGDKAGAAADWQALLKDLPADHPLRPAVVAGLAATDGPAAPGPDAGDVAAAADLPPDERQNMIEGMVQRLAERLKDEPGDLDGWLRLARAYDVLGRLPEAAAAWEKAAALKPDDPAIADGLAAARARLPVTRLPVK